MVMSSGPRPHPYPTLAPPTAASAQTQIQTKLHFPVFSCPVVCVQERNHLKAGHAHSKVLFCLPLFFWITRDFLPLQPLTALNSRCSCVWKSQEMHLSQTLRLDFCSFWNLMGTFSGACVCLHCSAVTWLADWVITVIKRQASVHN